MKQGPRMFIQCPYAIESLITILAYREQKIKELESENVTLKIRAEVAENKVRYLLKKLDEVKDET